MTRFLSKLTTITLALLVITFSSSAHAKKSMQDNLIAFVGELSSIEKKPSPRMIYDGVHRISHTLPNKWLATYKVKTILYGEDLVEEYVHEDMLSFSIYGYQDKPEFTLSQHALIYLSHRNNELYWQDAQATPVFMTESEQWAACGNPYEHEYHLYHGDIKAESITFNPALTFNIATMKAPEITEHYPTPYFSIANKQATCLQGNYIEELFAIKQNGVLTSRGIF